MMTDLRLGDCRELLAAVPEASVHACVTDPPYGIRFMGKGWDRGVPGVEFWSAVYRVLKPGAHLLAFGGTRTYHRMVCAIEDAGFEIRDQIGWAYGSGFPKSLDVAAAIDKAGGNPRPKVPGGGLGSANSFADDAWTQANQGKVNSKEPISPEAAAWEGWGTALKPAWEPIVVARKPLVGTVAENVLAHSTGALNIDGCRTEYTDEADKASATPQGRCTSGNIVGGGVDAERRVFERPEQKGRWPANLVHDGSDEVLACFPKVGASSGHLRNNGDFKSAAKGYEVAHVTRGHDDGGGSAARFFYCAKASRSERGEGNDHPTVKPVALMRWLVRLVTPPGGTVLDPFAGSGTTGLAAAAEGLCALLIESEPKYEAIARRRLAVNL